MKKVKVTQAYIDQLKKDRDRYKSELDLVQKDRQIFRDEFLKLLKDNVSLISKNEYYSAESMVNRLSRLMNKVQGWYW